ncbi:MAG: SGNH/GDSL hydrolase family protein [Candidatus Omnitrophica bacterium]|nr:SGNH/GDSL hydrolase family protein [Candidatus Omnitrophota bacterium]
MRFFCNFLLVLFGVVFAFFAAEIIFRASPYCDSLQSYSFENPFLDFGNIEAVRAAHGFGFELIPNSHPIINSYGMFDKEYDTEKTDATFRMEVLGDSITAELGGWTEILEERLNRNSNLKYDNVEIWNTALPGYGIRDYGLYWHSKGIRYKPDMLVIAFCLNDLDQPNIVVYKTKKGFLKYSFPYPDAEKYFNKYLFRTSAFYRFLLLRIQAIFASRISYQDAHYESAKGTLAAIGQSARQHAIDIVAIILPYLDPPDEYKKTEQEQYNEIGNTLIDLNIKFLDLYQFFDRDELRNFRKSDTPHDFTHPSIKGHERYAEVIYNFLLTEGYLD